VAAVTPEAEEEAEANSVTPTVTPSRRMCASDLAATGWTVSRGEREPGLGANSPHW
jgi:hypothetical protein